MRSLHTKLKKTRYQANRVLALLSRLMNLAETGQFGKLRPLNSNPCRHIEKFKEEKRERRLSGEEIAGLGRALIDTEAASPFATAAIRLLFFTGARLGEILGLKWEWVDFEHAEARLPDSKTGQKTIHLPPPAMAVLSELPRIEGNPHGIVGQVEGQSMVNIQKPWRRIREMAGLDDVRLHDLRHLFASVAVSSGMGLPIVGTMLGHTQAQTTQRYAHLYSDPVKATAATTAGKIADALNGRTEGGDVVPINGRTA